MTINNDLPNQVHHCVVLPTCKFFFDCQAIVRKIFEWLSQKTLQAFKVLKDYLWKPLIPSSYTGQLIHSFQSQPTFFEEKVPLEVFNQYFLPRLSVKELHNLALTNKMHLNLLRQVGVQEKLASLPANDYLKFASSLGFFLDKIKIHREWSMEALSALAKKLPQLKVLDANYCRNLNEATIRAFIQHCPHLLDLDFDHSREISDAAIVELAKSHPHLKRINLWACNEGTIQMTDKAIQALAQHCPNLEDLNIGWCRSVTELAICHLIRKCPELKSLNLSHINQVTDQTLSTLAENCPGLECLSLGDCFKITDAGFREFVPKCRFLKKVSLNSQHITDDAVDALAENCPHLTNAHLSSSAITEASIKRLIEKCSNLKYLAISRSCRISKEQFKQSYPQLRIEKVWF